MCARAHCTVAREAGDALSQHYVCTFLRKTERFVNVCERSQMSAGSGQQLFHPRGNSREGKPSVLVVMAARNKQPHPVPIGDKCC